MMDRIRLNSKKLALIYFENENSYVRTDSKKVIYDETNQALEDLIGKTVTVQDLSGKYTGMLKGIGSEEEICEMELELERVALDRSFEIRENTDAANEVESKFTHAVVCWKQDKKHSKVRMSKIQYDISAYPEQVDLVGKELKTQWKSGQIFDAYVRAVGTSDEMKQQLSFWKSRSKNSSNDASPICGIQNTHANSQINKDAVVVVTRISSDVPRKRKRNMEIQSLPVGPELQPARSNNRNAQTPEPERGPESGAVVLLDPPNPEDSIKDKIIAELQNELRLTKLAWQKDRSKKRKLQKLNPVEPGGKQVSVGAGLYISETEQDDLISYKGQPSLYLTNLNRYTKAFPLKVLAASSVKGVKTITCPEDGPRPPLDPILWAALKAFTIKECGIMGNSAKVSDFHRKISNICSNARKSVNARNTPRSNNAPDKENETIN